MSNQARILVVDDDPAIRKVIGDRLGTLGHHVSDAANGREALQKIDASRPALMILDLQMPLMDGFDVLAELEERDGAPDVIVVTAHGSIESAVRATQLGAADFIPKPFEPAHLEHAVAKVLRARGLERRVASLETELSARHTLVIGESAAMREVVEVAGRAARSDATILLLGESGTGKEILARYIHQHSNRAEGPFVAINCATLQEELLTSELFGHEKGAFTGAVAAKRGRIEKANGGTLFLDEVGELSPSLQAKLLRVLQEREFERVGGERTLEVDVRVVAATNRDLSEALEQGRVRKDLYYRLNVVSLEVPPLRERRDDIGELIEFFLDRHGREMGRSGMEFTPTAHAALVAYDWPGNVRELSNVVERAVVLARGSVIDVGDLPAELRGDDAAAAPRLAELGFHEAVAEAKRDIIRQALARCDGHQTNAAEMLGLTQPYLSRLMKKLGLRGD